MQLTLVIYRDLWTHSSYCQYLNIEHLHIDTKHCTCTSDVSDVRVLTDRTDSITSTADMEGNNIKCVVVYTLGEIVIPCLLLVCFDDAIHGICASSPRVYRGTSKIISWILVLFTCIALWKYIMSLHVLMTIIVDLYTGKCRSHCSSCNIMKKFHQNNTTSILEYVTKVGQNKSWTIFLKRVHAN